MTSIRVTIGDQLRNGLVGSNIEADGAKDGVTPQLWRENEGQPVAKPWEYVS